MSREGKERRVGDDGSQCFLSDFFSPSGHHCSSEAEFALGGTRIEKALWVSHSEPQCVRSCRS